jgi:SAM-dependent methyltransferase
MFLSFRRGGLPLSERKAGPWGLLEKWFVYKAFQDLLGGAQARQALVDQYVRPRPGDRVLDVGCGPASLFPLLRHVDYVGVDYNADYISHAKSLYGEAGRFIAADVTTEAFASEGLFDIILGVGLVHHLNDDQAAKLFGGVHRCLKPDGRVIMIDPALTTPQHWIARVIVTNDRGMHVRRLHEYEALAREQFSEVQAGIRTDLLRVPYTHAILECRA